MSLAVDVDRIASVLLLDGRWYDIDKRDDFVSSFTVDAYELVCGQQNGALVHASGDGGVCATGYAFRSGGVVVAGPLTGIVAVKYR
jgi:hypothetical protein